MDKCCFGCADSFTFTFTFICHPGETHNLRGSRGDTSRWAQTGCADSCAYSCFHTNSVHVHVPLASCQRAVGRPFLRRSPCTASSVQIHPRCAPRHLHTLAQCLWIVRARRVGWVLFKPVLEARPRWEASQRGDHPHSRERGQPRCKARHEGIIEKQAGAVHDRGLLQLAARQHVLLKQHDPRAQLRRRACLRATAHEVPAL